MTDWAAVFDATFAPPVSQVEIEVWREVLGAEYPEGLDAHSYISRTELAQFVDAVRAGPDGLLVDIGCGRGGPGLWVAAHTGARIVGVDIAASALAAARQRAESLGLQDRAEYRLGGFEQLPLTDGEADALMSVDALLFSVDKAEAAREMHRVLRPGGRLVFTSWDYYRQPEGRPPQVPDHRPLLEAAGFHVVSYDETTDWQDRQTRIGDGLLARVDELAAATGEDVEELRAGLQQMQATMASMTRRILVVAERQ